MTEKKLTAVCLCLFLASFSAAAQEITWTRAVNWEEGKLTLSLTAPLDQTGPNRPAAAMTAERRIDTNLSPVFSQAVLPVQIDSRLTFGEAIDEGIFPMAQLISAALTGKKGIPRYSQDMRSLSIDYTYALHDALADAFVRHKQPREIPRFLAWMPTREYTGIVIYAGGELPLHGEGAGSAVLPCLFPEIFDEDMNPVFTHDMGDPAWLKRWGSAAYSDSFDEAPWKERIGERPLRVIASGLYGKYPADLKIAREDAARILASPSNRGLLAEGRVLVIMEQRQKE